MPEKNAHIPGARAISNRVVDVDETVVEIKAPGQVASQGIRSETLGGMMSGGEIVDAQFPRQMHGLFRDLAADEGIQPMRGGDFDISLRGARAPADTAYLSGARVDPQRLASQSLRQQRCQRCRFDRCDELTGHADRRTVPRAEPIQWRDTEQAAETGIVAQLRVGIQWQMVGNQIDTGFEQGSDPALTDAGNDRRLTLPEPAVMHEQRIGLGRGRGLDQRQAGGHTGDQAFDARPSLDLQAIGRVVTKRRSIQQIVTISDQVAGLYHGGLVAFPLCWQAERHVSQSNTSHRKTSAAMKISKTARFVLQSATIGLAVAIVLLFLKPELLQRPRPVVEVHTSAPPPSTASRTPATRPRLISFADAVARAGPSVVNIFTLRPVRSLTDKPHAFKPNPSQGQERRPHRHERSLGSGVIISSQGYVLTNDHVISGATHILVMLADGRSTGARVIGSDPDTDLAVLHIDLPRLPAITIGDSKNLRVGDVVLAIGNPFGFGQTVTQGIVSAKGRSGFGINTYENFIQTDAAINPGNSGGALINTRGELIGINSVIFSRNGESQGISFAIPIHTAHRVMKQIIEQGYVTRGWLGIGLRPLTMTAARRAGLNHTLGIVVTRVLPGSPAEKAGIRPGDILIRIGDEDIVNAEQFMSMLAAIKPGTRIRIEGRRGQRPWSAITTVTQRPYPRR